MEIKKKIRVAILFGGRSAEHEVSLRSAQTVFDSLDREKYEPVLIGIDKHGRWLLQEKIAVLGDGSDSSVALIPSSGGSLKSMTSGATGGPIDVVFPVLHGPFGEDGTVQGLLKLANVPFVGAGVLGSAVGMDKDVMKRLLRDAGLPIGKFLVFRHTDAPQWERVTRELGAPVFVKPANLGSSVGVSKSRNEKEFTEAVAVAFQYDTKIITEEYIPGREIECAVLGNDAPSASVPGEIIPHHEFYSYEAKYLDENGASLEIPAQLADEMVKKIQAIAIQTFQALACEGLGRVDCFLTPDNKIFVNEINTIPGFTSISMYPKLWEASGISRRDLVDRLIQLALERFAREQKLKTNFL